ncbi:hypothetical protein CEXT_438061 [Caerostris extrusa]|uniref:Uncharacterized protein n=1 Tax=Caerostris extrusa TaxID=172846 RepID=A0AAV4RNT1_CAEEX|nr:hypothetical protein CEXT_438061 [Caerostris extrusa]
MLCYCRADIFNESVNLVLCDTNIDCIHQADRDNRAYGCHCWDYSSLAKLITFHSQPFEVEVPEFNACKYRYNGLYSKYSRCVWGDIKGRINSCCLGTDGR